MKPESIFWSLVLVAAMYLLMGPGSVFPVNAQGRVPAAAGLPAPAGGHTCGAGGGGCGCGGGALR